MRSFISVVLPCYNEEPNIHKAVVDADRAIHYLSKHYEIIVVDDGSTDGTKAVLEKDTRELDSLRVITHPENKGYGAAVMSGLNAATGDLILMVDADGQFDMREFSYVLKGLRYADAVIGYRIKRRDPLIRHINSFIFNWAVRIIFGLWVKDINCSMKGFHKEVIETLRVTSGGALINVDIMTQTMRRGFRVIQVPVHHFPRTAGISTGDNKKVIARSMYEFLRLTGREFPLRYKEFSFRQRTALGFICAIILLLFSKPVFGWHFFAGFALACTGLGLRNWAGGHLFKGKILAVTGPYAYIRHPLYIGSLALSSGFCLMAGNQQYPVITALLWILLISFFVGVYLQKIYDEEKNLARVFAEHYPAYARAVPRFLPFRGKYGGDKKPFDAARWKKNREYNSIIGFLLALLWLFIKMR